MDTHTSTKETNSSSLYKPAFFQMPPYMNGNIPVPTYAPQHMSGFYPSMSHYTPQPQKRDLGECDQTRPLQIAENKSNPDVHSEDVAKIALKQVTDEETDSKAGNFKKSPPGTVQEMKNGNFKMILSSFKTITMSEWKGSIYAHIWNNQLKCMSLTIDELEIILLNKDKIEGLLKILKDRCGQPVDSF